MHQIIRYSDLCLPEKSLEDKIGLYLLSSRMGQPGSLVLLGCRTSHVGQNFESLKKRRCARAIVQHKLGANKKTSALTYQGSFGWELCLCNNEKKTADAGGCNREILYLRNRPDCTRNLAGIAYKEFVTHWQGSQGTS